MKKYNIAIVGSTGMVGRTLIKVLEEINLPVNEYFMYSSKRSAGSTISLSGKDYTVIELTEENIKDKKVDIALFSAGGGTSLDYAPVFVKYGAVVVDNSSAWRMDPTVPLVVPEVNAKDIEWNNGIIANPNCSTIQAVVAIKPLHDAYKVKRIVYSTYQAVSGAGVAGWSDLEEGIKGNAPKKFPYPIFNNCLPHIDVFSDDGYTKEEIKMIEETRKILGEPNLRVTATTVRVPVFNSHSESINIEFEKPFKMEELVNILKNSDGVVVQDDVENNIYPIATNATDKNEVFVGRIRRDNSVENGVNLWVVADNIRKGAATNAVQVAQKLIEYWETK